MHRFLVAGFALALSACGGGDDFTIDVERPAERAYGQLSAFDGGMVRQYLGLPIPLRSSPGDGEVLYTIAGAGDSEQATLAFRVEPVDSGHSRVHVNIEMPRIKANFGGSEKVLNESKVEGEFRRKLQKWADGQKTGDDTRSVLELNEMMGAMVLAMHPKKIKEVMAMARQPSFLTDFLASQASWDGPSGEFAAADTPTSDPSRDAETGDDPADETRGADTTPGASDYSDYDQ